MKAALKYLILWLMYGEMRYVWLIWVGAGLLVAMATDGIVKIAAIAITSLVVWGHHWRVRERLRSAEFRAAVAIQILRRPARKDLIDDRLRRATGMLEGGLPADWKERAWTREP